MRRDKNLFFSLVFGCVWLEDRDRVNPTLSGIFGHTRDGSVPSNWPHRSVPRGRRSSVPRPSPPRAIRCSRSQGPPSRPSGPAPHRRVRCPFWPHLGRARGWRRRRANGATRSSRGCGGADPRCSSQARLEAQRPPGKAPPPTAPPNLSRARTRGWATGGGPGRGGRWRSRSGAGAGTPRERARPPAGSSWRARSGAGRGGGGLA